jgi:hypothetical protein
MCPKPQPIQPGDRCVGRGRLTYDAFRGTASGIFCDLVIRGRGDLALDGPVLTQNPADPSLGQARFGSHVLHTGAAAGGAETFC